MDSKGRLALSVPFLHFVRPEGFRKKLLPRAIVAVIALLAACAVWQVLGSQPAFASTIVTVAADADTENLSPIPGTTELRAGWNNRIVLRFSIPASGNQLGGATLKLYQTNSQFGLQAQVYESVDDSWVSGTPVPSETGTSLGSVPWPSGWPSKYYGWVSMSGSAALATLVSAHHGGSLCLVLYTGGGYRNWYRSGSASLILDYLPIVSTTTAGTIGLQGATSGGEVASDGGAAVTARGVCWGTSPNPTTSGSHTIDGTGTGIFTSSLTGLQTGTLYHYRAYATNSTGTSYGDDLTFTTLAPPTSADSAVNTLEDERYTFSLSDFPFTDADEGDTIQNVKITTLEGEGSLQLDGLDVTIDQEMSAADITAGKLTFDPAADANGSPYTTMGFMVSDGLAYSAAQTLTVNVAAVNDAPAITSDGGSDTASVSTAENQAAVTTITASDPDVGETLTYSITGGADAALFTINASTGALRFRSAPDFENPTDADHNNVYEVTVKVEDDGTLALSDTQAISITVTDVNEAPAITSDGGSDTASVSTAENQTAVTTITTSDPDVGETLTYSITAGADADLFTINASTGALRFRSAPDFENPTDADHNNVYEVTVKVEDDGTPALSDTQAISITVTDVNEAPTNISLSDTSLPENGGADVLVGTLSGTDPEADSLSFSLPAGTDDNTLFTVSGTELRANNSFDYETKASHRVTVRATDSHGLFYDKQFTITITNANDAPSITSDGGSDTASISRPENSTAVTTVTASDPDVGETLTYSITGGADAALFTINPSTAALNFRTAPDFENSTDADHNNVYEVTVKVEDDGTPALSDTQAILVSVNFVRPPVLNAAPRITSNGGSDVASVSIAENSTPVTTVTASDPNAGDALTYSITGGADAALFTINPSTGALRFRNAPDFENPTDADHNNVYEVTVKVEDDGTPPFSDTQAISITVTDVNEEPPTGSDRWKDITDEQWQDLYAVTAEQIDKVADGTNDGYFHPTALITRGQFAKMAIDGFGISTAASGSSSFFDVPATYVFFPWIQGGADDRLLNGFDDGSYRPQEPITRRHANTILGRYLSAQELESKGFVHGEHGAYVTLAAWYAAEGSSLLAPFVDAGKLGSSHALYTAYLVYKGVVHGTTVGGLRYLMPLLNLTRAQAAVMIVRANE